MKRRIFKALTALILIFLALALSASCLAVSVEVNSASAKLYSSKSTSGRSVALPKGTRLTLKDVSGDWARVSRGGVTGYVQVKYLDATSRYAAYTNRSTYIYRSASSSSDRVSVGVNTKVYVVGISGDYLRVENSSGSRTGYVPAGSLSRHRQSAPQSGGWKSKVVKLNWFKGGSDVLKEGSYGTIYDIDTGITVRIKRMGGHNHADVEPATADDTAKLKKIAGGSFSWDSHAVILHAGGKYVACSINTMPHGDQTIHSNGYDGQFCLHMAGSLTHNSGTLNEAHQAAINRAYSWAHGH